MIRRALMIIVALLLFGSALGLVTAQHRTRSLFVDLDSAQQEARQLDVDYERLTIEQARLAQPAAVERAALKLGFRAAEPGRTVYLNVPEASAAAPLAPGARK